MGTLRNAKQKFLSVNPQCPFYIILKVIQLMKKYALNKSIVRETLGEVGKSPDKQRRHKRTLAPLWGGLCQYGTDMRFTFVPDQKNTADLAVNCRHIFLFLYKFQGYIVVFHETICLKYRTFQIFNE